MLRLSLYYISNTIICKMKEDNLEELWCHYSGMPSPLAYTQKEKDMNKSEQIEEIGTAISECLIKLYETKEPLSFNPFPKMYHPTEDAISIPLVVDGKKLIIEIKTV